MLRAALVAFSLTTIATAAMAQSTGIAVCDQLFRTYELCIETKVPAAESAAFRAELERGRKHYSDLADVYRRLSELATSPDLQAKVRRDLESSLEDLCTADARARMSRLTNYGCAF
jgi:hypothetical protein